MRLQRCNGCRRYLRIYLSESLNKKSDQLYPHKKKNNKKSDLSGYEGHSKRTKKGSPSSDFRYVPVKQDTSLDKPSNTYTKRVLENKPKSQLSLRKSHFLLPLKSCHKSSSSSSEKFRKKKTFASFSRTDALKTPAPHRVTLENCFFEILSSFFL